MADAWSRAYRHEIEEEVFTGWSYTGLARPVLFTGWFELSSGRRAPERIYFDEGRVVTEREHEQQIERSLRGAISLA